MTFTRTHYIGNLDSSFEGQKVTIGGWLEDLRELGKLVFLTIRDATGITQVVVKQNKVEQNKELAYEMEKLSRQSIVRIEGAVQKTKARDFAFEIDCENLKLLTEAVHPLPIDPIGRLESGIDNRLNARALDLRNPKSAAIFKLRHKVLSYLRKHLVDEGFFEINTPKIIGSASEGGANLFSVDYFGRKAYLAQSPQLYKEQLTLSMERVFEIDSYYRAEKSHTTRHLSEFWMVDLEAAFMDYDDVMGVLERLVSNVVDDVLNNCKDELSYLGKRIEKPSVPFERITYQQAIDELNESGVTTNDNENGGKLSFGDDLQDAHLKELSKNHPGFYFLVDWPMSLKPFYIHEKDEDPKISRSFDLQFGYLELSSGGTRLYDPNKIKSRLQEQDLDPTAFKEHLQSFEWGMPPHSGWGMGLERLMTILTGIDNVKEMVLYPRDPERISP